MKFATNYQTVRNNTNTYVAEGVIEALSFGGFLVAAAAVYCVIKKEQKLRKLEQKLKN